MFERVPAHGPEPPLANDSSGEVRWVHKYDVAGRKVNARLTILIAGAFAIWHGALAQTNFKPQNGLVPNAETAIKIAVAVWIPIYGEKVVASEKPYRASLIDGIWTVQGTLPEGALGGTAIAEISKDDGRVLRVIHEQ